MGLFSSIAGYFGKKKLAKASKKAATAQSDALQSGINTVNTAQQQAIGGITAAQEQAIQALNSGQTSALDAINTGKTGAVDAINSGLTGATGAITAQQGANDLAVQQALATLSPYLTQGAGAVGAQSNLLGLNGADQQRAALAGIEGGPILQSILRGGQEDILSTASATGGLRGGNTINDLTNFRMDALSRVLTDQLGQLGGVANRGFAAAGQAGEFGLTGAGLNSDLASTLAQLQARGGEGIAGVLEGAGVNSANLQSSNAQLIAALKSGDAAAIAQILGGNAETIASLMSGQGAAKAGGILGKAKYNAAALGDLASAAGSVASAFLPTGGFGGTVRGFI
jgi:hypothetical protein